MTTVEDAATDAFNSRSVRIRVTFADADKDAADRPARLVLKRNGTAAWAVEAGRREAAFCLLAAELTPPPPCLAPCLAAGIDETTGESFVLMPDLSATYVPTATRASQVDCVVCPANPRSSPV